MKSWMLAVIILLFIGIYIEWEQVEYANNRWKTAEANVKAYSMELSNADKKNTALQLTVDQLGYFQDSILRKLDETRKELKIKDKNLKALQQVTSSFVRVDTITMRDTLFKEPTLAVDTVFGDEWYTMKLGLRYPSMVVVEPQFKSEKHIIVSTKKETVNPPKKFFLLRWLQRKHVILNVDVIEKNPYVDGESSRYVEIIK